MAKFLIITGASGNLAQAWHDLPSADRAIQQALRGLQAVVHQNPQLVDASALVGEGAAIESVRWLGAWFWRADEGFYWTDDQT